MIDQDEKLLQDRFIEGFNKGLAERKPTLEMVLADFRRMKEREAEQARTFKEIVKGVILFAIAFTFPAFIGFGLAKLHIITGIPRWVFAMMPITAMLTFFTFKFWIQDDSIKK